MSHYNPNMPVTNCKSIILIEKPEFNGFFGAQNQLPITFCSDLYAIRHLRLES